jgi:hypothetical protein
MSEFIAVGWVKKLENSPQPDVCGLADAGTDVELGGMEVDLAEDVVNLTPWESDETHVDACVGVAEQIHSCESEASV